MLTLLCWSRKVVQLGSGLSVHWLLWHLCDRGFLGCVVLHRSLHSHLQKEQEEEEKKRKMRLNKNEKGEKGTSSVGHEEKCQVFVSDIGSADLGSSCFDRLDGSSFLLNSWLLLH